MDELILLPMTPGKQSILFAVRKYGKSLFSFIRSRVGNDADAEDILQDVWYQLSLIIETETIEQLSAWLYRVSRNRITDRNRKHKTESLEDLTFEGDEGEMVFPDALLADSTNPETELEKEFFMLEFMEALNELPEKQRQVFIWNEMEDLTLQEIADKTGESIKTIISRKRYAVASLKKQLQDNYDEY
jgi:RNA polymerase sigma factor (sigma-70 family)